MTRICCTRPRGEDIQVSGRDVCQRQIACLWAMMVNLPISEVCRYTHREKAREREKKKKKKRKRKEEEEEEEEEEKGGRPPRKFFSPAAVATTPPP